MSSLFLAAFLTGLGGAFTPCTMGTNIVMIQHLNKKARAERLREWLIFATMRAIFLAAIGLLLGYLGHIVTDFTWWFQMLVNIGIVVLGIIFILGKNRPILPGLNLAAKLKIGKNMSAAALGSLFGLNITACIAPLVLAIVAKAVLAGNVLWSGLALFIFGIMLSLPILVAIFNENASQWISNIGQRYRKILYPLVGAVLIFLGLFEIYLSFL